MKKAILEFENEDELLDAINGVKFKHALWELDQWLRQKVKYAPESSDAAYIMAFKECREELRLHLNGLDIE